MIFLLFQIFFNKGYNTESNLEKNRIIQKINRKNNLYVRKGKEIGEGTECSP